MTGPIPAAVLASRSRKVPGVPALTGLIPAAALAWPGTAGHTAPPAAEPAGQPLVAMTAALAPMTVLACSGPTAVGNAGAPASAPADHRPAAVPTAAAQAKGPTRPPAAARAAHHPAAVLTAPPPEKGPICPPAAPAARRPAGLTGPARAEVLTGPAPAEVLTGPRPAEVAAAEAIAPPPIDRRGWLIRCDRWAPIRAAGRRALRVNSALAAQDRPQPGTADCPAMPSRRLATHRRQDGRGGHAARAAVAGHSAIRRPVLRAEPRCVRAAGRGDRVDTRSSADNRWHRGRADASRAAGRSRPARQVPRSLGQRHRVLASARSHRVGRPHTVAGRQPRRPSRSGVDQLRAVWHARSPRP
jgi:hypothetical protein